MKSYLNKNIKNLKLIIILSYLKTELNFSYRGILISLSKTFVPLLVMSIVAIVIDKIVGYPTSTLLVIIKTGIIGIIGIVIYFTLLYTNKGLEETFGRETVDNIMKKLHIKK